MSVLWRQDLLPGAYALNNAGPFACRTSRIKDFPLQYSTLLHWPFSTMQAHFSVEDGKPNLWMKKIYWRVGLLFFWPLVLLCFVVDYGASQLSEGEALHVRYQYTGPIKPGAFVRVSGMEVGRVIDVESVGAQTLLNSSTAHIQPEVFGILTTSARFYVTTMGVLGEYYLDIEPRAGGEALNLVRKSRDKTCLALICYSRERRAGEVLMRC